MKNAVLADRPPAKPITVLVADDHALVRAGIKMLVASMLDDVRFLEASDGDSLSQAMGMDPRVSLALVDLRMPGMEDGLRLVELAHRYPKIPLVVVSALSSPDVVRRTLPISTVCAFVPKTASTGYLRSAIQAALQGRKLSLAQVGPSGTPPISALTPRQEEIRVLLRQGLSNKMIAGILGISEGTVKNHITEIFRVLNATNRTQAAQFTFEAM